MKLGIMQPYFFPYIGYFQMIKAVDKFVSYNDVTFIKQGWINRNRILCNGKPQLFSVPLYKASSHILIRNTLINYNEYDKWATRFYKTLDQSYHKAPFYNDTMLLIENVIKQEHQYIAAMSTHSIQMVCNYLGVNTPIQTAVTDYHNDHLKAENRVLDICRQELATVYINADGGRELYSREHFKDKGIELRFLKSKKIEYSQFNNDFIPWLSIIDVLMFNSPDEVNKMLGECEIA